MWPFARRVEIACGRSHLPLRCPGPVWPFARARQQLRVWLFAPPVTRRWRTSRVAVRRLGEATARVSRGHSQHESCRLRASFLPVWSFRTGRQTIFSGGGAHAHEETLPNSRGRSHVLSHRETFSRGRSQTQPGRVPVARVHLGLVPKVFLFVCSLRTKNKQVSRVVVRNGGTSVARRSSSGQRFRVVGRSRKLFGLGRVARRTNGGSGIPCGRSQLADPFGGQSQEART